MSDAMSPPWIWQAVTNALQKVPTPRRTLRVQVTQVFNATSSMRISDAQYWIEGFMDPAVLQEALESMDVTSFPQLSGCIIKLDDFRLERTLSTVDGINELTLFCSKISLLNSQQNEPFGTPADINSVSQFRPQLAEPTCPIPLSARVAQRSCAVHIPAGQDAFRWYLANVSRVQTIIEDDTGDLTVAEDPLYGTGVVVSRTEEYDGEDFCTPMALSAPLVVTEPGSPQTVPIDDYDGQSSVGSPERLKSPPRPAVPAVASFPPGPETQQMMDLLTGLAAISTPPRAPAPSHPAAPQRSPGLAHSSGPDTQQLLEMVAAQVPPTTHVDSQQTQQAVVTSSASSSSPPATLRPPAAAGRISAVDRALGLIPATPPVAPTPPPAQAPAGPPPPPPSPPPRPPVSHAHQASQSPPPSPSMLPPSPPPPPPAAVPPRRQASATATQPIYTADGQALSLESSTFAWDVYMYALRKAQQQRDRRK